MPDILPAPTTDILSLFRLNVPDALTREIIRCIRDASRAAAEEVDGRYPSDQARECQPWIRRAELGTALLGLSSLYPNFIATSEKSRGSTYYVRLQSGAFTLLVARSPDANKILPQATYRLEIATNSAQEDLFGPAPVSPTATFYGVILYGGPSAEADPQFVVLRFPTRDHAEYLDARIDLKGEFIDLFREPTPIEQIADESRNLTLRLHRDTGSSDQT